MLVAFSHSFNWIKLLVICGPHFFILKVSLNHIWNTTKLVVDSLKSFLDPFCLPRYICFQALSSGTYVNISQSPDHCQTSQSAQVIPTSGALLSLTQTGTFYLIVKKMIFSFNLVWLKIDCLCLINTSEFVNRDLLQIPVMLV